MRLLHERTRIWFRNYFSVLNLHSRIICSLLTSRFSCNSRLSFSCHTLTPATLSLVMATARNRSGTISSQLTSQLQAHPIYFDGSVRLQMSVHPNAALDYPNVLLNRDRWPAIQVGDIIELTASHMKEPCVFIIDQNDPVGLSLNVQVCHKSGTTWDQTLTKLARYLFRGILQNVLVCLLAWRSL
jgi:hypothetical protein